MKLLRDYLTEDIEYLTEDKEGVKNLYITGPFMMAEKINRNGRAYPLSILEREVARYIKEKVNENMAWGELNHPQGPQINFDRVSHRIVELKQDGNCFYGKALITNTPCGNIVKGLIESGGKVGVSSRGMGSLKPMREGHNEVQDDYFLATAADVVADPSMHTAFVNGIMEEKEWIFESGVWKEAELVAAKQEIHRVSKSQLEEAKLSLFKKFLGSL
jgi:hypothetical protein